MDVKNALETKAKGKLEKKSVAAQMKDILESENYRRRFDEVLGKRSGQFISALIATVNTRTDLTTCTPMSIIQSALKAATFDLPIDPGLGFAYLVPFKNTKAGGIKECQFMLGYKGYIQLALRTAAYKNINVVDIREGELVKWDPLTEELEVAFIEDEEKREKLEVIGYAGYFSLVNGFEKKTYWSKKKINAHRNKYSKNATGSIWSVDFDGMAKKTVLRNMISKYGILSIDMHYGSNAAMARAIEHENHLLEDGHDESEQPDIPAEYEDVTPPEAEGATPGQTKLTD
jgi:recombination protein RecT